MTKRSVRGILKSKKAANLLYGPWASTSSHQGLCLRGRHVIGHDIEQYFEIERTGVGNETAPCRFAAEIGADSRGVRYIIPMRAAGNRLKTGRQVHMADSQLGQVGQNLLRCAQRESRVQLQAIGRDPISAHDLRAPGTLRRASPSDFVPPVPCPRSRPAVRCRMPLSIRHDRAQRKSEMALVRDGH